MPSRNRSWPGCSPLPRSLRRSRLRPHLSVWRKHKSVRSRIAVFVVIIQLVLFLAHWFLYETWTAFWGAPGSSVISKLQVTLALLSVSFVIASLLAWQSSHLAVRVLYRISAVWLGVLSFCFLAACSCWTIYGGAR